MSLKSWKFVILPLKRYLKDQRAFYWDNGEERNRKNKTHRFIPIEEKVNRENQYYNNLRLKIYFTYSTFSPPLTQNR